MIFSSFNIYRPAPWVFVSVEKEVGNLAAAGPLHVPPAPASTPCLPRLAQLVPSQYSLPGSLKTPEVSLPWLCHCLGCLSSMAYFFFFCNPTFLRVLAAHFYIQYKLGYVGGPWPQNTLILLRAMTHEVTRHISFRTPRPA